MISPASTRTATATIAGRMARITAPHGMIFERPERPSPKTARTPAWTTAPTAPLRPRRGPS